ncbi:MAG: GNAT family N-acetyltransferase [Bdellovibrionales bacterium]|nr:GNAT family N-acetyltransferase [Bdellovibrionales bacterium]
MKISDLSLGWQSEIMLLQPSSSVEERVDHLVVRTPAQPDYMWGNFLFFDREPGPGDYETWTALYRRYFGANTWFITLAWPSTNSPGTERQTFLRNGFQAEGCTVLINRNLRRPERFESHLEVRPLLTAAEWTAAAQAHIRYLCTSTTPGNDQIDFAERRFAAFRALHDAQRGHLFGAFLAGEFVGQMGLYHAGVGARYGRFQEVMIHPEFRRRGLCRSLVYLACAHMQTHYGLREFVTFAEDPDALSAYHSTGFLVEETTYALRWYDAALRAKNGS